MDIQMFTGRVQDRLAAVTSQVKSKCPAVDGISPSAGLSADGRLA